MRKSTRIVFLLLMICGSAAAVFSQDLTKELDWYNYDDSTDHGSSVCRFSLAEEQINGQQVLIAVMSGSVSTQFKYGYAGMGAKPKPEILALFKKAKGLKFWVIGDGRTYRFKTETSDVRDYDYFGKTFSTDPGKPVEVTVYFKDLVQEGWGKQIDFDKNKIWQISWQTVGQPHDSITLKVYGIKVIK